MLLNQLQPGVKAQITQLSVQNQVLYERMLDFGICEKTMVCVLTKAPFGGPIVFRADNQCICIRNCEAAKITVNVL
jgi:ferrous iron transport protein A